MLLLYDAHRVRGAKEDEFDAAHHFMIFKIGLQTIGRQMLETADRIAS